VPSPRLARAARPARRVMWPPRGTGRPCGSGPERAPAGTHPPPQDTAAVGQAQLASRALAVGSPHRERLQRDAESGGVDVSNVFEFRYRGSSSSPGACSARARGRCPDLRRRLRSRCRSAVLPGLRGGTRKPRQRCCTWDRGGSSRGQLAKLDDVIMGGVVAFFPGHCGKRLRAKVRSDADFGSGARSADRSPAAARRLAATLPWGR
jgi:hypothetical protein